MMIFIEKPDDLMFSEAADSLAVKLVSQVNPNAIILLNSIEMELMKDAYIVGIPDKSNPVELIEIDRDKEYIAVCDESVNFGDLSRLITAEKLAIRIVRVYCNG